MDTVSTILWTAAITSGLWMCYLGYKMHRSLKYLLSTLESVTKTHETDK
jgi:hypothetical protein